MLAKTSQIEFNEKISDDRVFFGTNALRDDFFKKLKNQFGTWTKLKEDLKTYKSRLERFRNGSISLPHTSFLYLLNYLDKKDREFFLSGISVKDSNWGRAKGGHTTYGRYPEIFQEGRKIGRLRTKYTFHIDTLLTVELAELIGAFIGDGFTNSYGSAYIVQFTGDRDLDRDYHLNKLLPLIKKISSNSNPILTELEGTRRITVYSKEFYNLLTKRFHFNKGVKTYTVNIPKEILESQDQSIINRCIRGIFDTDGYVFYDKRRSYNKPYLRIGVQMASRELIMMLHTLLNGQGIKATITNDCKKVQINGFDECEKFVKLVGFSNWRHLRKLDFLREQPQLSPEALGFT